MASIKSHLAQTPTLVIPGFFAHHVDGGLCRLGRGGSDFTALYLAAALDAACVLLKDVDGLYESDPAASHASPRRFALADYATAQRCGGGLVQPKTIEVARAARISIEVTKIGSPHRTHIGEVPTIFGSPARAPRLKVALLGLGAVGGGVFEYLQQFREDFEVVAALVRTPRSTSREESRKGSWCLPRKKP